MTPAERDAAVALAREITSAWDGVGCHVARVEVLSDGGDSGGTVYDKRHAALARAVLALAERPTCEANERVTAEGHCRVKHVELDVTDIRDIARGYYRYRTDYPNRISLSSSLLTPTVDQVLQTMAAKLCSDHEPQP